MAARAEMVLKIFEGKCNGAQSVPYSYSKDLGLDPEPSVTIASGFGGGMGRKQEVCGAVTGGIMVLGLVPGTGNCMNGTDRMELA